MLKETWKAEAGQMLSNKIAFLLHSVLSFVDSPPKCSVIYMACLIMSISTLDAIGMRSVFR